MNPSSSSYQFILDQLREQSGYDFLSLAFAQSAEDRFVISWQYASGNLNTRYRRIVLQSGKGIAGIVYKTGKPMLVSSVGQEIQQQNLFNYPILVSERLNSLLAIPLYKLDRVEGVLLAGYREEKRMKEGDLQQLYKLLQGRFVDYEIKELSIQ